MFLQHSHMSMLPEICCLDVDMSDLITNHTTLTTMAHFSIILLPSNLKSYFEDMYIDILNERSNKGGVILKTMIDVNWHSKLG